MSGVNKVILIGNLGRMPEIKYLPSGSAVCNFSIATSEKFKTREGGMKEETEWHKIVAFGRTAEVCAEFLSKGSKIYLEGKLKTRSWDDKDGNKKYSTEIVCSQMQMLDSKKDSAAPAAQQQGAIDPLVGSSFEGDGLVLEPDDVPF